MSAVEILEELAVNVDLTFDKLSDEEKQKLNRYLSEPKHFETVNLQVSEPDSEQDEEQESPEPIEAE